VYKKKKKTKPNHPYKKEKEKGGEERAVNFFWSGSVSSLNALQAPHCCKQGIPDKTR